MGIASFGFYCGLLPGVYARVSNVASWIDSIIQLETGGGNATVFVTKSATVTAPAETVRTTLTERTTLRTTLTSIQQLTQTKTETQIQRQTEIRWATQIVTSPSPYPVLFTTTMRLMQYSTMMQQVWVTVTSVRRSTTTKRVTKTVFRFRNRAAVGGTVGPLEAER